MFVNIAHSCYYFQVKEILDSVNFPIKKGIKSCDAVLK